MNIRKHEDLMLAKLKEWKEENKKKARELRAAYKCNKTKNSHAVQDIIYERLTSNKSFGPAGMLSPEQIYSNVF